MSDAGEQQFYNIAWANQDDWDAYGVRLRLGLLNEMLTNT